MDGNCLIPTYVTNQLVEIGILREYTYACELDEILGLEIPNCPCVVRNFEKMLWSTMIMTFHPVEPTCHTYHGGQERLQGIWSSSTHVQSMSTQLQSTAVSPQLRPRKTLRQDATRQWLISLLLRPLKHLRDSAQITELLSGSGRSSLILFFDTCTLSLQFISASSLLRVHLCLQFISAESKTLLSNRNAWREEKLPSQIISIFFVWVMSGIRTFCTAPVCTRNSTIYKLTCTFHCLVLVKFPTCKPRWLVRHRRKTSLIITALKKMLRNSRHTVTVRNVMKPFKAGEFGYVWQPEIIRIFIAMFINDR